MINEREVPLPGIARPLFLFNIRSFTLQCVEQHRGNAEQRDCRDANAEKDI